MGSVPDSVCGMGTIYPADDTDFWAFEVTESDLKVRIETGGLYDGDTVIILFNSDGEQIAADDDSGEGTFSRIDLGARGIALPVGYYLVAVTDAQRRFSSSAPYILSVTGERPAETEETPASGSPCYVQNCTGVGFAWQVHYWDSRGVMTFDYGGARGDLRWTGNQFYASRTESWGDPRDVQEDDRGDHLRRGFGRLRDRAPPPDLVPLCAMAEWSVGLRDNRPDHASRPPHPGSGVRGRS